MILHSSRLLASALLIVALSSAADDKDRERLHKQAVDAGQQGHTRLARDLFCELANQRPSDKSAKQECDVWTSELEAEIKHYEADFQSAQSFLKQEDCDGAELGFSHVLEGPHLQAAKAALKEDVPSCFYDRGRKSFQVGRYDLAADSFARVCCGSHASQAKAAVSDEIPAARKADETFHAAETAFGGGHIEEAEKLFRSVSIGQYVEEAGDYVEKRIPKWYFDRGEEAFRERRLDDAEKYLRKVCCSPYAEEAAIYLRERIPRARNSALEQAQFEKAEQAYVANDFDTAHTLFSQFRADPGDDFGSQAAMYLKDINEYQQSMACGRKNEQKNCPTARECYTAAATIKRDGPGNPSAKLQSLSCASHDSAPNDTFLIDGIREFQRRNYPDAEVHLGDFLKQNDRHPSDKTARAHFYFGASKVSRYFLDPRGDQLLQEARANLCVALRTTGFTLSNSEMAYISPRIMDTYRSSCH